MRQIIRFLFLFSLLLVLSACRGLQFPSLDGSESRFGLSSIELGTGTYSSPLWSPDGTSLAFKFRDRQGAENLWIFDTSTEEFKQIYQQFWSSWPPVWRNNDHITYRGTLGGLWSVNIHSDKNEVIWEDTERWEWYSIDPTNPNRIIVEKRSATLLNPWQPSDLYEIDLGTSQETRLTETKDVSEESPFISADGQTIVYIEVRGLIVRAGEGARGGTWDVVVQQPDRTITLKLPFFDSVSLTSDAEGVVFRTLADPRSVYHTPAYKDPGLYVVMLDEPDRPIPLLTDGVPSGTARFSWSATTSRLAVTTIGIPGRNQLLISDPIELDALFERLQSDGLNS